MLFHVVSQFVCRDIFRCLPKRWCQGVASSVLTGFWLLVRWLHGSIAGLWQSYYDLLKNSVITLVYICFAHWGLIRLKWWWCGHFSRQWTVSWFSRVIDRKCCGCGWMVPSRIASRMGLLSISGWDTGHGCRVQFMSRGSLTSFQCAGCDLCLQSPTINCHFVTNISCLTTTVCIVSSWLMAFIH